MRARILDLERQLDARLGRPRVTSTFKEVPHFADLWAAAVWQAAESDAPLDLSPEEISRGLVLARRPVFVCGVHRSGTTLMRDLLDGHAALSVLPSEGTMFTNLEGHLSRLPRREWLPFIGREWLRRLANPIYQQPYWLLGRSSAERSPYVEFARALITWWALVAEHLEPETSAWPLTAVALAYAHCTNKLNASLRVRYWVEKTPNNEDFLERLRLEFPGAKLIHMVRHPFAVFASHRQGARNGKIRLRGVKRILDQMDRSYRTAAALRGDVQREWYRLVRYEDLLANTRETMELIAAFLDIEPLPTLLQPTANEQPTLSNTSFWQEQLPAGGVNSRVAKRPHDLLSRFDRERLSAVLGEAPKSLGYELLSVTPRRRKLLHLATKAGI